SVGSGSLIIVILLMIYPMLKAGDLVGTDLVQAVPLVASASLGHILFGDFRPGLTTALLIGAIPGAFIGAQISSRAKSGVVRRALLFVLLASAVKLLGLSNTELAVILVGAAVLSPGVWVLLRRRKGLPSFGRTEKVLIAAAQSAAGVDPEGSPRPRES